MARPKSMPDFSALLDASTPLTAREHARKKPSISLAAGLIMNSTESPKNFSNSPVRMRQDGEGELSENLFYAYAQKVYGPSDYAQAPPYVLTFANASVANQWWNLVQSEYPSSTREGPQLFILKGEDMQEQIQDNPRFYALQNKWFYSPASETTPVIPLQDWKGNPVDASPAPARRKTDSGIPESKEEDAPSFDMATLNDTLSRMNAMISENAAQIKALSVAQGEGLQRMQEINESTTTQIKTLADGQTKLQSLISDNASHYIALSNSSFANQEQAKSVLQSNADNIQALAQAQTQLAHTCAGMLKTIDGLGSTVSRVGDNVSQLQHSSSTDFSSSTPFSNVGNRISPPPRKLNRKIKGVWYEYDSGSPMSSPRQSVSMASPRMSHMLATPPKSPASTKV
ncbi:hypothetical protein EJ04DRAFT_510291 [Polyplosphaeria fusca]|uniref:Uncharacterized protein n=1 Tax=Polyplosphaeria fusca TaxID=682080 RepID=A0A9P4V2H1_9PLEO|nr:hypothetical protein EJ04DRAFT_510291 [Polyplosphaeria fusca]